MQRCRKTPHWLRVFFVPRESGCQARSTRMSWSSEPLSANRFRSRQLALISPGSQLKPAPSTRRTSTVWTGSFPPPGRSLKPCPNRQQKPRWIPSAFCGSPAGRSPHFAVQPVRWRAVNWLSGSKAIPNCCGRTCFAPLASGRGPPPISPCACSLIQMPGCATMSHWFQERHASAFWSRRIRRAPATDCSRTTPSVGPPGAPTLPCTCGRQLQADPGRRLPISCRRKWRCPPKASKGWIRARVPGGRRAPTGHLFLQQAKLLR